MTSIAAALVAAALSFAIGCSNAGAGALLGSAVGAGTGAAIDHNNRGRGALIGAAVGAGAGYIAGNEIDKSKQRKEDRQEEEY